MLYMLQFKVQVENDDVLVLVFDYLFSVPCDNSEENNFRIFHRFISCAKLQLYVGTMFELTKTTPPLSK